MVCRKLRVVVREEQQQNTVQNAYIQIVYDAATSNFLYTHHHFVPQYDNVNVNV